MAKDAAKTTVSITPGQNEPVNNVLQFEDLVQQAQQGAAKSAKSRATMSTPPPGGNGAMNRTGREG